MASDIRISYTSARRVEFVKRLFQISGQHGGLLLRVIRYFSHIPGVQGNTGTECAVSLNYVDHKQQQKRRNRVLEKYLSLKEAQRALCD